MIVRVWNWSEGFSAWFELTAGGKALELSYQLAQI